MNKTLRAEYPVPRQTTLALNMLSEMVRPVNEDFELQIYNDLAYRGLKNPLVAVLLSGREWANDKATNNPDILDPPTADHKMYWRLQCGNVRYRAAKALGYTHIDVIVFPTIYDAEQWCAANRKKNCR